MEEEIAGCLRACLPACLLCLLLVCPLPTACLPACLLLTTCVPADLPASLPASIFTQGSSEACPRHMFEPPQGTSSIQEQSSAWRLVLAAGEQDLTTR